MVQLMASCVSASSITNRPSHGRVHRAAPWRNWEKGLKHVAIGGMLAGCLWMTPVVQAAPKFPPISTAPNRCERGFGGNTIGQANAVADTLLDLRECVYRKMDLTSTVLAGGLLQDSDFSGATLDGASFSKAFAMGASFEGANMSNAILDRTDFSGASFKGANLTNSVITGTKFDRANLEGANFEDALIGSEDVKRLCLNETLTGESRLQVGCRT